MIKYYTKSNEQKKTPVKFNTDLIYDIYK